MRQAAQFDDHHSQVWRLSWNITGTILCSSGDDGCVRLWKGGYVFRFLCFKIYFLLVLPKWCALSYLQPTTWTTGKTLPFSKVTRHSKQTTQFRMRRSLPVKRKLLPLRVSLDQGTQWRLLLANTKSLGINALLKYNSCALTTVVQKNPLLFT